MDATSPRLTEAVTFDSVLDGRGIGRFQVLIIVICAIVSMVDGFDTQSIALAAPSIGTQFGVPSADFGLVFGIGLFGGLIGAVILGSVSDRVGRKPVLLASVALVAVASLCTPFADNLLLLGTIRFITGLGLGGALPCVIALTSEYAPIRSRAATVALMFCGFPLGAVVGGLASTVLIPRFGWPSVFIAGGAVPLILLPIIAVFVPESVRFLALRTDKKALAAVLDRMHVDRALAGAITPTRTASRAPFVQLFAPGRALGTVMLWIILLLSLLMTYFLTNWIPLIAHQNGLDARVGILGAVMLNLGSIVGSLLLGRLVRRYPGWSIAGGYVLGALTIVMIGQSGHSVALLLVSTFLTGVFAIGAQLCAVGLSSTYYIDSLRATGVGAAVGVARIGAIAGPVLGGVLIGAGVSTPAIFVVIAIVSLAAAAAMVVMAVELRRPTSAASPGDQRIELTIR